MTIRGSGVSVTGIGFASTPQKPGWRRPAPAVMVEPARVADSCGLQRLATLDALTILASSVCAGLEPCEPHFTRAPGSAASSPSPRRPNRGIARELSVWCASFDHHPRLVVREPRADRRRDRQRRSDDPDALPRERWARAARAHDPIVRATEPDATARSVEQKLGDVAGRHSVEVVDVAVTSKAAAELVASRHGVPVLRARRAKLDVAGWRATRDQIVDDRESTLGGERGRSVEQARATLDQLGVESIGHRSLRRCGRSVVPGDEL